MATAYPAALDTSTQQPSPSASTDLDTSGYEHDVIHTNHSGALIAVETKLGVGSTTGAGASTGQILVKQADGDTEWATPAPSTAAFIFSKVGDLVAAAGKGRLKVPMAVTIVDVIATCNTAPVGANAIFDVHKGGTTIFSTQGNRPTVVAGNQDGAAAVPDVTAVTAGDVLTVDIDQIGSSTAGADATVVIRYTAV